MVWGISFLQFLNVGFIFNGPNRGIVCDTHRLYEHPIIFLFYFSCFFTIMYAYAANSALIVFLVDVFSVYAICWFCHNFCQHPGFLVYSYINLNSVRCCVFCLRHDCYVCPDNMEGIDVHHWQWIPCCRRSFWKHGTGIQASKSISRMNASVVLYQIFSTMINSVMCILIWFSTINSVVLILDLCWSSTKYFSKKREAAYILKTVCQYNLSVSFWS